MDSYEHLEIVRIILCFTLNTPYLLKKNVYHTHIVHDAILLGRLRATLYAGQLQHHCDWLDSPKLNENNVCIPETNPSLKAHVEG